MKLFDEDGNYVGEFVKDSLDEVKDSATASFEKGDWLWGLFILFFIYPWWALFIFIVYIICKTVGMLFKLFVNILWWLIRLPFCIIFKKELPKF